MKKLIILLSIFFCGCTSKSDNFSNIENSILNAIPAVNKISKKSYQSNPKYEVYKKNKEENGIQITEYSRGGNVILTSLQLESGNVHTLSVESDRVLLIMESEFSNYIMPIANVPSHLAYCLNLNQSGQLQNIIVLKNDSLHEAFSFNNLTPIPFSGNQMQMELEMAPILNKAFAPVFNLIE